MVMMWMVTGIEVKVVVVEEDKVARAVEDKVVEAAEEVVVAVEAVAAEVKEAEAVKVDVDLAVGDQVVRVVLEVREDLAAQAFGQIVPTTWTVMVASGQEFLDKVHLQVASRWTSSAATEALAAEHRPAKAANGASSVRTIAS